MRSRHFLSAAASLLLVACDSKDALSLEILGQAIAYAQTNNDNIVCSSTTFAPDELTANREVILNIIGSGTQCVVTDQRGNTVPRSAFASPAP